ncbi:MAG: hypothetical protein ISS92_02345 [Candidatus Omnitrophica bacterium]|nr:hypothetical protein [Candidatus Omnitrophota bacterium]
MKKTVFMGIVIVAALGIVAAFFMPWAEVATSVTGVSKELTGIAKDELEGTPIAGKVIGELKKVTDVIGDIGDIKLKTKVSGYNVPVLVNRRTSKIAISAAQIMFKSTEGLDWKSYLVYLLPILGITCALLAIAGSKQKIYIIVMLVIAGAVSIIGLYNLYTANLTSLIVKISIEKGLWYTMYAFLLIFIAGITWLILDKKT